MDPLDDSDALKRDIAASLRRLFHAENPNGNHELAANFFAEDCLPIVRASGQPDESRQQMLDKFGSRADFHRLVDHAAIDVALFLDNQVAIATTLLPTIDSSEGTPVTASYLNRHVLLRRDGRWECVSWQVTKQTSFSPGVLKSLIDALMR